MLGANPNPHNEWSNGASRRGSARSWLVAKRKRIELQDGEKTLGGSRPQLKRGVGILFLTDGALQKACDECASYDKYRCGIAVCGKQFREQVFNKIVEYINSTQDKREGILRIYKDYEQRQIAWKNGSVMLLLTDSQNARGIAFHKLIVDKTIDQKIISNILLPTEKLPTDWSAVDA